MVSGAEPAANTRRRKWEGYIAGVMVAVFTPALNVLSGQFLQLVDVAMLFVLGVVVIATLYGLGPSLVAALLGIPAFWFIVLPPPMSWTVIEAEHAVTLGCMLAVAVLVSGLTERLRREQHRSQRLASDAEKARVDVERERVRNALLSSVSHDLRTPLSTISASAQVLIRDHATMPEEARGQVLSSISDQALRLDDLVRNLLAMTRVETSELTLHKLPGSVAEVVDAARRRVDRVLAGRPVTVTSERGIPLVDMDGQLLEQVFVNVLENAARHTPPGRAITVRIGADGARVVTTVEDEGPGVAEDERELIFEKFYRGKGTRPDDGGLGLGLTICRASVMAHGGTIDLANRVGGGGAVVTIALPASSVDLTSAGELLPDVP